MTEKQFKKAMADKAKKMAKKVKRSTKKENEKIRFQNLKNHGSLLEARRKLLKRSGELYKEIEKAMESGDLSKANEIHEKEIKLLSHIFYINVYTNYCILLGEILSAFYKKESKKILMQEFKINDMIRDLEEHGDCKFIYNSDKF